MEARQFNAWHNDFLINRAAQAIYHRQAIETSDNHRTTADSLAADCRETPRQQMVHVGNLVREVFDRQPKGHNIMWFARQLNCNRSNIYDIFNRPTLDTELLRRISIILRHDFFRDLSETLPPGLSPTSLDSRHSV